jgi:alpha-beta hydrolase superfamily lysophospholipase
MSRVIAVLALLVVVIASNAACFSLDGFLWAPHQCSTVDPNSDACKSENACTPCDKPYPFEANGIPLSAVQQVTVKISGGQTLDSYFISSGGARSDDVVVYAHGNATGLEHYLNRVKLLFDMGVTIFAIDYRGFGKSSTTQTPDEPTFMDDVHHTRAALEPLLPPNARVFAYGYSAGALAAVELAKTTKPCALLLEAPFPSVQAFADDSSFVSLPDSFLASGTWDDIAKIHDVHVPLLQFHGDADDYIRLALGEKVFHSANEPKQLNIVHGANHGNGGNDIPTVLGNEYADDVEQFLDAQSCD